jgi:hypothetical protein
MHLYGTRETYCGSHHLYDAAASSTSGVADTSSVTLKYGTGEVAGAFGYDAACVGGACVGSAVFLRVDEMSASIRNDRADALVGLAWPSISRTIDGRVVEPLFDLLAADGALDSDRDGPFAGDPVFSFFLSRSLGSGADPDGASDIILGGFDLSRTAGGNADALTTVPLARTDYWSVAVDTVFLDDEDLGGCGTGSSSGSSPLPCYGVVDTGTSFLVLPDRVFDALFRKFAAVEGVTCDAKRAEATGEIWCSPCPVDVGVFPQITFAIDGTGYGLSPHDYVIKYVQGRATGCAVEAMRFNLGGVYDNSFILGDTFLRRYASAFNMNPKRPSVSFATVAGAAPLNVTVKVPPHHGLGGGGLSTAVVVAFFVVTAFGLIALAVTAFTIVRNRRRRPIVRRGAASAFMPLYAAPPAGPVAGAGGPFPPHAQAHAFHAPTGQQQHPRHQQQYAGPAAATTAPFTQVSSARGPTPASPQLDYTRLENED